MNETRTLWDMLEMDRIEKASLDGPGSLPRRVRDAWYERFQSSQAQPVLNDMGGWIEEVFDTHVVVSRDEGTYYSYPFSVDEGGEIQFGEPEKVERRYVPV